MTFKLAIAAFFWAPVSVSLVGDMGARIEGEFKAKYKRLTQQQYEDLLARIRLPVKPSDEADATAEEEQEGFQGWRITDKEMLDLVLLDWDDLVDENDQKIPYTPDNLEQKVEPVMGARAALVSAFFDAHVKAPEKKSGPRRGTTTAG
jgi:hypothetical protein